MVGFVHAQHIAVVYTAGDVSLLPDNAQWIHRMEIRSQTSSRLYVVAQHKTTGQFGCSCMGWIRYRKCKHLAVMLPLLQRTNPTLKIR